MSTIEIISAIKELEELEDLIHEAEQEAENIRDSIKATMTEQGTDELIAGTKIVRWTTVLTTRFDSTAFKKRHEDLYKEYTKQTTSRRFSISK